jgi:hypothetical protein
MAKSRLSGARQPRWGCVQFGLREKRAMTRRPSDAVGRKTRRRETTWAITSTGSRKPPEAQLIEGGKIYLAELGEPGKYPLRNFRYLRGPKSSGQKQAHIHPLLSPDGSLAFFNSDESGVLQAYLIRGLG